MRHIDLFSGIGGFALASSWVWGYEYQNIGHSEIEEYPCKVYHRHFPESECLGDVTKIGWERFAGTIDLLTGGFPCQPHSVAGKRKASSDERDLWGECKRAVRLVRPRYALFENVPGLLTSERGGFFNRVLSDLAEIGYDAEWYTIGAWQVGAPHKRDRIWIVAYPEQSRRGCGEIHSRDIREALGAGETNTPFAGGSKSEDVAHASGNGLQGSGTDRNTKRQVGLRRGAGENQDQHICHSSIAGLPDWSGGEMGQPWPVTEFERPSGEDVPNPDNRRCSPVLNAGSGAEKIGGGENDIEPISTSIEDDSNSIGNAERSTHGEDCGDGIGGRNTEDSIERDEVRGNVGNLGGERKSRQREVERDFRGVPYGVSNRVDRLKGLGNAIVPQVAFVILGAIKERMK